MCIIKGPPTLPFQGQKPPNSFGAPPGAPSAPGVPPYPVNTGIGFNLPPAPTSFGMPQPHSPYPAANFPSYSPHGDQRQTAFQPQQYQMNENRSAGSSPQFRNHGAYPSHQAPYSSGNSSYTTGGALYRSNPNQFPGHSVPYSQNTFQHATHSTSYQSNSQSFPNTTTSPYPNRTASAPSGVGIYPENSSPYPGMRNPGGQGMGVAYSQHAIRTTSSSPQRTVSVPRRVQPIKKVR